MTCYFAGVKGKTGEIARLVTLGEPDTEYAQSLFGDELLAIELDDDGYQAANSGTCYWDFDAKVVVSLGMPPYEGAIYDFVSHEWVEGRSLAQVKAARWIEIKERRAVVEATGFQWRGIPIDNDDSSRSKLVSYALIAQNVPGFHVEWTTSDNGEISLGAEELREICAQLGDYTNAVHAVGRGLRAQINCCTTIDAVKAVEWPSD